MQVGIHHAGLCESDRTTVERLFVSQAIMVLVCTSTLAWGVNFPAHLVVVKGTEFYDAKTKRYVDSPVTDGLCMQVLTTAPCPHRYVDFPVTDVLQMMALHASAHNSAVSPQVRRLSCDRCASDDGTRGSAAIRRPWHRSDPCARAQEDVLPQVPVNDNLFRFRRET